MQPVGAKRADLDCVGLDINAKPSCNKICCDGQKQRTQSKKDIESYSFLEKFSWSSPGFVGLPMDAARCILDVRLSFCLLQRAEMGTEL